MNTRHLGEQESWPFELLLEADPSRQLITVYMHQGHCFVAEQQDGIMGVFVLLALDEETVEIKNIALAERERGKGLGRKLVIAALAEAQRLGFRRVEIGTGNSSLGQLALYQKCGFRMHAVDRDFFLRNYPEPIFENGIECRDMVRLVYHF